MKKRRPSTEDSALWERVKKTTKPLRSNGLRLSDIYSSRPAKDRSAKAAKLVHASPPILEPFQIGEKAAMMPPPQSTTASHLMDKKNLRRLLSGKMAIDRKLDLHGCSLPEAEALFIRNIEGAQKAGLRLLLVITGKGHHTKTDEFRRETSGVIRRALPIWCQKYPVREHILHYCAAHPKHGGSGAYYIYLRRKR